MSFLYAEPTPITRKDKIDADPRLNSNFIAITFGTRQPNDR